MAAKRRRRRRSYRPATRRRTTRRRRRNPLIMSPNPNPRRRRRRNPGKLNMKNIVNRTLTYGGGGLLAYAANQFGLRNVENDWLRRGLQAGAAVAGAMMLKGELGAAFAGGMFYPLAADLALTLGVVSAGDYELAELAADLDQALTQGGHLDGISLEGQSVDELYVDDVLGTQPYVW